MFTRKQKKISPTRARRTFNAIFAGVAFLTAIALSLTGGFASEGLDLAEGSISTRRIQSPRNIVNEAATQARREAAANQARQSLIYLQDDDITRLALDRLNTFFDEIEYMRRLHNPVFDPANPYVQPVPVNALDRARLSIDVPTNIHFTFLITTPSEVFSTFRDVVTEITMARMNAGVREEALAGVYLLVREELAMMEEWDATVRNAGYNIIHQVLRANIFVDWESITAAAYAAMEATPPVVILQGENIILEGQVVTAEIYAILSDLGLLGTGGLFERVAPLTGALMSVTAVFIMGLLFIMTLYRKIMLDKKNVVLLFTLFMLTIISAWFIQYSELSFVFVPILLFTMLTSVLLDERLAIGFCVSVSIISSVIFMGDLRFVVFFILTGIFVAITSKMVTERSKMLSVTILMSAFSFFTVCAVYLVAERAQSVEMWDAAVLAAVFGILSTIACVGVLPLFETAFGFVTTVKLLELSNPNHPLLRRLIIEAPGTYQHSLVVANLAETACYSIGANYSLARVGAYYHDVGKLSYPNYFVENQTDGKNPHDDMDPHHSVKIINEHVSNGLVLAEQYKLPRRIKFFIEEHHGGSVHRYFYHKAKELALQEGDDKTVNEDDFKYKFKLPYSREVAVVTLADIAEAAVRSAMQEGKITIEELPDFLAQLIKGPLNEGRLIDSGLIIKDLTTIAEAFNRVFKGMFHERIAYPKKEEKNDAPFE